jgi:fibronectin-binding autotransporter adhesin
MQAPMSCNQRRFPDERANIRSRRASLALVAATAMCGGAHANTVYTWQNTSDTWSDPAAWLSGGSNVVPTSGSTTELDFGGSGSAVYTSTDDLASPFQLTEIQLGSSASVTETITGDSLSGISTLNQNGTGAFNINNALALTSTLTIGGAGTGAVALGGAISGNAGVTFTNTTATGASTTFGISGANSYTGTTTVASGSTAGDVITLNVSGDQSAATGGWLIAATGGNNVGLSTVNFQIGSHIAVANGNIFQIGYTSATGTTQLVNVAGTVNNAGALAVDRAGSLSISNGGVWNQSGVMAISSENGGVSDGVNVQSGGVFDYSNSTSIPINPASSSSGHANLTIAGTFDTSAGFTSNGSTGSGVSSINLSGTLLLNSGSTISTLIASPIEVALTGTTPTINTNGSASANSNTITSIISGASSATLTKTGTGTLTLAAANTYTGATNVVGGTLALAPTASSTNNILSSSAIIVGSGATLDVTGLTSNTLVLGSGQALGGSGTVTGSISLSSGAGTISAGTSTVLGAGISKTVGILTTTGSNTWTAGGNYAWKMTYAGVPSSHISNVAGADTDELIMSGLTVSGSPNIYASGSITSVTAVGTYNWVLANLGTNGLTIGGSAAILNAGTNLAGAGFTLNTAGLTGSASGLTNSYSMFYETESGNNDLVLSDTTSAAPEPTSLLFFGSVLSPALLARRRRHVRPSKCQFGVFNDGIGRPHG